MATPTNADETIIWRIVVETQKSFDDTQKLRQEIDAMKETMKRTAKETGQSFREVATSLKLAFSEESKKRIREIREEMQELRKSVQEYNRLLKETPPSPTQAVKLDELAPNVARFRELKDELMKISIEGGRFRASVGGALRELNAEAKAAEKGINILGMKFSGLGDILKFVFVGLLGGSIIGVFRQFISLLTEAAEKANKFVKAIFQLELGIRALRRVGIDITTQEMLNNLDKINASLGMVFSKVQLIEGAAQFSNLIRNLGFTKDEIFELQKAVATFAVVNGRAMDDVQRTIALALSSGYTEGLQRLGVSINRLTIAEKAATLGFEGGYTALTEQQRAMATQIILLEQAALYADDLATYQTTLAGQLEITNAQLVDQKALLGKDILPLQKAWNNLLIAFYNLLRLGIKLFTPFIALGDAFAAVLVSWGESIEETEKIISEGKIFTAKFWFDKAVDTAEIFVETFFSRLLSAFRDKEVIVDIELNLKQPKISIREGVFGEQVGLGKEVWDENVDRLISAIEDAGNKTLTLEEETAKKRKKLNEDLQDDLAKITQDGVGDRLKIESDYLADLDKLERDAAHRRADLARDLQQRLTDIDRNLDVSISEADIRYAFDVKEVAIKFQEDIAKAAEDYRQKEIERERKFQEELLRLREDYLIDLEDALENRDARAVLRARRAYKLEQERARRENEAAKVGNEEGYKQELEEIARRRDARLRDLQFELQQRLAELQRQAQREREEAQRRYERELEDLKIKLDRENYERYIAYLEAKRNQEDQEKAETLRRMLQYETELIELQKFEDDKIAIMAEAVAKQAELAKMGADAVYRVLLAYFGEGGMARRVYEGYLAYVNAIGNMFKSPIPPHPTSKLKEPPKLTKPGAGPFASGGAIVARQPVTATFGEVPEVAIFAPLNKLDQLPKLLGGMMGGNAQGNLGIRIMLSPGLEASIVDQALNGVANVIIENNRVREAL